MALAAIFDETRFQRRLDPGNAAEVDVRFLLFARGDLDIEIKQGLAIDDSHTQLFTLSCVDQHTLHCRVSLQALEPLPRVARYPKVSRRAIRLDRSTGRGSACLLNCRRFPGVSAHLVHARPETLCHREGGKQSPIRTVTITRALQTCAPLKLEFRHQGSGRHNR